VADLAAIARRPVAGALPEGAATLDGAAFVQVARQGLSPALGGLFDHESFGHAPGDVCRCRRLPICDLEIVADRSGPAPP
jgi:dethiobiotin synthetase